MGCTLCGALVLVQCRTLNIPDKLVHTGCVVMNWFTASNSHYSAVHRAVASAVRFELHPS